MSLLIAAAAGEVCRDLLQFATIEPPLLTKDELDKGSLTSQRTAYGEVYRLTTFEKAIKDRLLMVGVTIDTSALNRNLVGGGAVISYSRSL